MRKPLCIFAALILASYAALGAGLNDLMRKFGQLWTDPADSAAVQVNADGTRAVAWVTIHEPNINYLAMDDNFHSIVRGRKLILVVRRLGSSVAPSAVVKDALRYDNACIVPAGGSVKYTSMIAEQWFAYDHWGTLRVALPPGEYSFDILWYNISTGGSLGGTFDFGGASEFRGGKEYVLRPKFTNPPG